MDINATTRSYFYAQVRCCLPKYAFRCMSSIGAFDCFACLPYKTLLRDGGR